MDGIEVARKPAIGAAQVPTMLGLYPGDIVEGIPLHELERIVRLRLVIHTDHVEPGPVVADRRAAGAAEQVEEARPHAASRLARRASLPAARHSPQRHFSFTYIASVPCVIFENFLRPCPRPTKLPDSLSGSTTTCASRQHCAEQNGSASHSARVAYRH